MGRFGFWLIWLKCVGIGLVGFGVFMALFNSSILFKLFNEGIDPVFWGSTLADEGPLAFRTWVYGAWGATIAGWGLCLLFVLYNAFSRRERWAWYAIGAGLSIWYLLDTGISVHFDVTFNVIFNSLIMLMVVLPLAGSYRYFRS